MNWTDIFQGVVIVVAFVYLFGLAWAAFAMSTAKEGREDEDGFHEV